MKKRFLLPLIAIAAPLSIGIADAAIHQIGCGMGHQGACKELETRKLRGKVMNIEAAKRCIETDGADYQVCDRVDAFYIPEDLKAPFAAADKKSLVVAVKQKAIAAKKKAEQDAKNKAALEKMRAERAKFEAEQAKANAAAEAKFKAEGWWEQTPGIFVRWCTKTCNNSKVIGSNRYSLMEVWAKNRPAGDIYARVNLIKNGVVIGWTNDTAYLSQGQRGVLTFDSYQYFDSAQITEFRARG